MVVVEFDWRHSIARPENPLLYAKISGYVLYEPSYSRFCPKFRCRDHSGHPGLNLNNAVK